MKNSIGQERNPRVKLGEKSDLFFVNEWKKKGFHLWNWQKESPKSGEKWFEGKNWEKKVFSRERKHVKLREEEMFFFSLTLTH